MKIVLAIDGSDYSKIAVNELGAMPLPAGTEVCIKCVRKSHVGRSNGWHAW